MNSIGETLRGERLRRDLDLEQISRELKISVRFLEAIEEEAFDKLPGGVFAKSFVRQYAYLLGFDGEEFAAEVQRNIQPAAPPAEVPQSVTRQPVRTDIHVPRVDRWESLAEPRFGRTGPLSSLALVVVVMLFCSGVYAWWQRTRHSSTTRQEAAVSVPAQAAQTAQSQSPPVATGNPAGAAAPAPANAPQAQPGPASADRGAEPAPAAQSATPVQPASTQPVTPLQPASTEQPGTVANPNGSVHLELKADEPVWVLAKADGRYLFSGTIDANQVRTLEANGTVVLRIGNAGGVTITLNGKPVGSLGPKGQVRTVQFTSGGFKIVAAPKPPVPLDPIDPL